ncbi:triphosphoribosyl-dephospho-CoA synthase [Clavibacter michiganensis subsp. insidiosus]|uniref:triphosphoribosyl-dephospho-CoA synthase n=3 Tax=Clavibacter michiganensis TaxID=28447 RepID=UPI000D546C7F|nr:triphosphoribosyl-dephospho-CoA synthase [Clavibacter michiganensis subsp. insidiosus]
MIAVTMIDVRPASAAGAAATRRRVDELADHAVAALTAEATLTPKPGLVDLRGPGAHDDMDVETLIRSAESLRGTFRELAAAGVGSRPGPDLRERLAEIGRRGEAAMMAATGGVNTHRGAIWALGLVVAAAAADPTGTPGDLVASAAATALHPDRRAPQPTTPGSLVRARYRVPGAVGEAQAGFPHAILGLDTMRARLAAGAPPTEAHLDALLAIVAVLDDTCLLHRGGVHGLRAAQVGASRALDLGGASTAAGALALARLDAQLTGSRLSPGGSADLLALALLLHALESAPLDTSHPILRKDT